MKWKGTTICRGRVLVVDHDRQLRTTLCEVLSAADLEVRSREALVVLETFAPDVPLVDVEMPGMNGGPVVAALRARDSRRFVVISMSGGVEASASPARWFLRNPFAIDPLLQVVNDFVAARATQPRVA